MGASESSEEKYIQGDDHDDEKSSDASLSDDEEKATAVRSESEISVEKNDSYASIMFRGSDKIYILWGDDEMRSVAKSVIDQHWGIQSSKYRDATIACLKLKGFPFNQVKIGNDSALLLRIAAADLLRELLSIGWQLVACSNLTRTNSVGSWFFRKLGLQNEDRRAHDLFAILSISTSDEINLANVSDELAQTLIQTIADSYKPGIQEVSNKGNMCKNIKLKGRPWTGGGEFKADGRLTIMALMRVLEESRYRFYGTSNIKGTADTMYFYPLDIGDEATQHASYVLISLDDNDDIRIFQAPDDLIKEITDSAITPCWANGIQNSSSTHHSDGHQWKLKGKPWWSDGENAVAARMMLVRIFDAMSVHGYEHYATIDMSRKLSDKSCFIFRTATQEGQPKMTHACISMSSDDKLRLIDFGPDDKIDALIRSVICRTWKKGLQEERSLGHATEFKLNGSPWSEQLTNWQTVSMARVLMTDVLSVMESRGWQLVSAADVSAKYFADRYTRYPVDVDSWFFGRPTNNQGSNKGVKFSVTSYSSDNYAEHGASLYPNFD